MEIDIKAIAAFLTFVRFRNSDSYHSEREIADAYMDILKRIKETDDETDKSL